MQIRRKNILKDNYINENNDYNKISKDRLLKLSPRCFTIECKLNFHRYTHNKIEYVNHESNVSIHKMVHGNQKKIQERAKYRILHNALNE